MGVWQVHVMNEKRQDLILHKRRGALLMFTAALPRWIITHRDRPRYVSKMQLPPELLRLDEIEEAFREKPPFDGPAAARRGRGEERTENAKTRYRRIAHTQKGTGAVSAPR
jgi:hypothetical protein